MERKIEFTLAEDFQPAFARAGIDPATLTDDEWRKFVDAFCDGTHWSEVAEIAADVVLTLRSAGR